MRRWAMWMGMTCLALLSPGCTEKKEKQPPPAKIAAALDAKLDGAQKPKDGPPAQAGFLGRLSLPGAPKIKPHWGRPLEELPALLVVKADYVHGGKKGVGRLLLDLNKLKTAKLALEPVPPLWAGLEEEGCAVGEAHLLFKGPAGMALTTLTLTGFLSPPLDETKAVFRMILELKPDPQGQPFSLQVLPDHFAREAFGGGGKALKPLAKGQFAPLEELPDELTVTAGGAAWLPLSRHTPPKPLLKVGGPAPAGASVRIEGTGAGVVRLSVSQNNDLGVFGLAPGEQTMSVVSVATGKKKVIRLTVRPAQTLAAPAKTIRAFAQAGGEGDAAQGPTVISRQADGDTEDWVSLFPTQGKPQVRIAPVKGAPKAKRLAAHGNRLLVLEGEILSAFRPRTKAPDTLEKVWSLKLPVNMVQLAAEGDALAMMGEGGRELVVWRLRGDQPPVSEAALPLGQPVGRFFWRWGELWATGHDGAVTQWTREKEKWTRRQVLPARAGTQYFDALVLQDADLLLAEPARGVLRFKGMGTQAKLTAEVKAPCAVSRLAPGGDGQILTGCLGAGAANLSFVGQGVATGGDTALLGLVNLAAQPPTSRPLAAGPGVVFLATPWPGGYLAASVTGQKTKQSAWTVFSPQGQVIKKVTGPSVDLGVEPQPAVLMEVGGLWLLDGGGKLWRVTP